MQNPNLPPGAQPVPAGGPQQPPKLTKEQKKALAEQQKRIQQEKMRALELSKLVTNFSRELASSVIDTPMMYKLGANRLKLMLKADHASVALFEEYPELGKICIIREQSNLPVVKVEKKKEDDKKKPPQDQQAPPGQKDKKKAKKGDEKDEEEKPKVPVPKPPPKEPPKPGQLPDLEGVFIHHLQVVEQIRASNKPIMIPDVAQFSDKNVLQFSQWYGIKSMLLLPIVVNGEVVGIMSVYKTTNPQVFSQIEIMHTQKAIEVLTRSVETAPPVLPDQLKDKVIAKVNKADNSSYVLQYYSDYLDDVFYFMIGELKEEDAAELLELQENQKNADNLLRKVWYQLGKIIELKEKPEQAYLCNIAVNELAEQAFEYVEAKQGKDPPGLKQLQKILSKMLKRPNPLEPLDKSDENEVEWELVEELVETIDKEISQAVRGQLLFNAQRKATLINDIEQSEMLVNFVSVGAAMDFRQHIQANIPETAESEDIDVPELLNMLSHQGMREISQVVAQNIAEKYLYEMEGFLEKPEEYQKEQMSRLREYIHYRLMANLAPILRGKSSLWGKLIQERIKEQTRKAAKQRALLVGRMGSEEEDEEYEDEEDWEE